MNRRMTEKLLIGFAVSAMLCASVIGYSRATTSQPEAKRATVSTKYIVQESPERRRKTDRVYKKLERMIVEKDNSKRETLLDELSKEGTGLDFSDYYADLYYRQGKYERALAKFREKGPRTTYFYWDLEDCTRRVEGKDAVKALRRFYMDKSIGGYSPNSIMRDYELNEEQAFMFLHIWSSPDPSLEEWRALLSQYPRSLMLWTQYERRLEDFGRSKEIIPMLEELYRRGNAKERAKMRPFWNLDYKRLDAEDKP